MSVYVDDMRARYHGMTMCHMIADSTAELVEMANRLQLGRWIQKAGTHKEHLDICLRNREQAIRFGAIPITRRELTLKIRQRK